MDVLAAASHNVTQRLIHKIFTQRGCNITVVSTGQEVLDYLANPANPRPSLVFLKTTMPVLDGVQTAYILRTQPPFALDSVLRATPLIGIGSPMAWGRKMLYLDDLLGMPLRGSHVEKMVLRWMRRELAPGSGSGSSAGAGAGAGSGHGLAFQPVWGPFPFRKYRGPRSLL